MDEEGQEEVVMLEVVVEEVDGSMVALVAVW
jgi:hypothetical protein